MLERDLESHREKLETHFAREDNSEDDVGHLPDPHVASILKGLRVVSKRVARLLKRDQRVGLVVVCRGHHDGV